MIHVAVLAGLDPVGGAGLLADARVIAEHGLRAVGVVTASTVQDTLGVRAVHPVPTDVVVDSLSTLLADTRVDAVKVGMLGTVEIASAVARVLATADAPVVWDPILLPSRGGVPLLAGDVTVAVATLLPHVRVVTPNLAEAQVLAGMPVVDVATMERAARVLVGLGARAVLVKGGHLDGPACDVLVDGETVQVFEGPRLDTGLTHGTGCVLSSALACALAQGQPLADAVRHAKEHVAARLTSLLSVGRGARCLV